MTRQEAIDLLEEVKYNDDSMYAYSEAYCEALDMAIVALRSQEPNEPKVLTFQEATGDGECWLECKNGACGYAEIFCCTGPGDVEVWRCFRQEPEYLRIDDFMKVWRCWTYKPTDEQREATSWERLN